MKDNKGITLVALVITIIVLLILAGVTVASLSGEDGLLTRGSQAVHRSNVSDAKEKVTLAFDNIMSGFYDAKYVTNNLGGQTAVKYVYTEMNKMLSSGGQLENVVTLTEPSGEGASETFKITLKDLKQQEANQTDKTSGGDISVDVVVSGNAAKLTTWSDSTNKN